jgi:hypothetical protein
MANERTMTVGELTDEHYGWYVQVDEPGWIGHRSFVLTNIRRWEHDGQTWSGLVDDGEGRTTYRTDRHYAPTTRCVLLRPITAKAKRAARSSSVEVSR